MQLPSVRKVMCVGLTIQYGAKLDLRSHYGEPTDQWDIEVRLYDVDVLLSFQGVGGNVVCNITNPISKRCRTVASVLFNQELPTRHEIQKCHVTYLVM